MGLSSVIVESRFSDVNKIVQQFSMKLRVQGRIERSG